MFVLISWPALALLPAALFLYAFTRTRRGTTLAAGLAWLAYAPYEYAMLRRWLCSGECNIRVDLLLIYPMLLVLSATALVAVLRRPRVRR